MSESDTSQRASTSGYKGGRELVHTQLEKSLLKLDDTMQNLAQVLEKQIAKDAKDSGIQIWSALSAVGVFIASLSISLLSYAASLAQNKALDNKPLKVLNTIWFATAIGSLFISSGAGIAAVARGKDVKFRPSYLERISRIGIMSLLFLMLTVMYAGIVVLARQPNIIFRLSK